MDATSTFFDDTMGFVLRVNGIQLNSLSNIK